MGVKTRKNKKRTHAQRAVRRVDVIELLSQRLFPAAMSALEKLTQNESVSKHADLLVEVYDATASAIEQWTFTPDEPSRLKEMADRMLDQAAGVSEVEKIRQAHDRLSRSLCLRAEDSQSEDPNQLARLADQSLLRPELQKRVPDELASEIEAVREALARVEAGDDSGAIESLAGIGFRSVMAPWRLLIRGMVSFYQGDFDTAENTWKRLPVDRLPFGIARAMLGTIRRTLNEHPLPDRRGLASLSNNDDQTDQHWRDQLDQWFDNGEIERIAEQLGRWSRSSNASGQPRVSPQWIAAMRDRLYGELLDECDVQSIRRITHDLPAPDYDPDLQFPVAIAEMLSSDPSQGIDWSNVNAFLQSLDQNQSVAEIDRKAIHALLCRQVAGMLIELLVPLSQGQANNQAMENERVDVGKAIGQAFVSKIHDCVSRFPDWDLPMELLSLPIERQFLPVGELEAIHTMRLQSRPDNLDVLKTSLDFFLRIENWEQSEILSSKLRAVAPRDPEFIVMGWNTDIQLARQYVFDGDLDAASVVVDRMEQNLPADMSPGVVSLYRACIALKAGDSEQAQSLIEEASSHGLSSLAVAFLMHIYAARMKLSSAVKKRFSGQRTSLLKTCSLAELKDTCHHCGHAVTGQGHDYVGRASHLKDLIGAAKRVLNKAKVRDWTPELATTVGTFVVLAEDGVLRRGFLRSLGAKFRKLPIAVLVRAIDEDSDTAFYDLQEIDLHSDGPGSLPPLLHSIVEEFLRRSRMTQGFMDDDDEFDLDELEHVDPDLLLSTMPPEMIAMYKQDSKGMERGMRETMPPEIADALILALRKRYR